MRRLLLLFPLLAAAGAVSAETIEGRVVAVSDGDSLTIVDKDAKRHRVRLAGIDAPERKQAFGAEARKSLAEICLRKTAVIEATEKDANNRLLGKVRCGEVDANTEQVRRGMAWVRAGSNLPTSGLPEMEANARLRGIGLWAGEKPEAPWEWRKRQAEAAKK
jgi:endonuclease YncB( thermonuclease family)